MISTILYLENEPVGYDVFPVPKGLLFKPASDTHYSKNAPVILAHENSGAWEINTKDAELTEQVFKIIRINGLLDLPAELSVAS